MLELKERIATTEELAIVLSYSDDLRIYFRLAILDVGHRNRLLQALPTNLNKARDAAEHAIALCLADGWTANPSWLESVLARVNLSAQRQDFVSILSRVQAQGRCLLGALRMESQGQGRVPERQRGCVRTPAKQAGSWPRPKAALLGAMRME